MENNITLRFTFYVLLLLIVACTPAAEAPVATPVLLDEPTAVALPTLTPISDPIATATPIPPATPVVTNDGYPVAEVAPEDSETSYPAPDTDEPTANEGRIAPISVSPNGEWRVFMRSQVVKIETSDEDGWQDTLSVEHISGEPSYTLKEQTRNFGLGYTLPHVLEWTADSSRVYFGDKNIVDGGGVFAGFKTVSYFDFQTLVVTDLYTDDAYNLAIASDYLTVATVGWGPNPAVVIHQLGDNSSQSVTLPMDVEYAGNIHWSSDNSYLIVTTSNDTFSENPTRSFVRINANDGTNQVLWQNVPNEPNIVDWIGEGNLPIRDRNGNEWRLNPDTAELITVE